MVRLQVLAPPSYLGLNIGGPPTGFSTGSRKLEDRHSVNTGDSSWVALSPECLRSRDCDSRRRDSRVVARAQIVSYESSFVTLAGRGSGSWSGNDTTK